jgi:hypothetical protein
MTIQAVDRAVEPPPGAEVVELGGGPALELGIGTGRIALPLSRRGVAVHGIDLSPAMAARLRSRPGGSDIPVVIGDLARVTVGAAFRLVYLVRNTITNLTSQDEQVDAFRNAAAQYDVATQIAISHHYWTIEGQLTRFSSPHRYVWPSELDLMARLAGLTPRGRWSDWDRSPFTRESRSHISVWEKPRQG